MPPTPEEEEIEVALGYSHSTLVSQAVQILSMPVRALRPQLTVCRVKFLYGRPNPINAR